MSFKSIINTQECYEAPVCEVLAVSAESILCESDGDVSANPGDWNAGNDDWFTE